MKNIIDLEEARRRIATIRLHETFARIGREFSEDLKRSGLPSDMERVRVRPRSSQPDGSPRAPGSQESDESS